MELRLSCTNPSVWGDLCQNPLSRAYMWSCITTILFCRYSCYHHFSVCLSCGFHKTPPLFWTKHHWLIHHREISALSSTFGMSVNSIADVHLSPSLNTKATTTLYSYPAWNRYKDWNLRRIPGHGSRVKADLSRSWPAGINLHRLNFIRYFLKFPTPLWVGWGSCIWELHL